MVAGVVRRRTKAGREKGKNDPGRIRICNLQRGVREQPETGALTITLQDHLSALAVWILISQRGPVWGDNASHSATSQVDEVLPGYSVGPAHQQNPTRCPSLIEASGVG